nr:hypothetical protein Iba_chr08dCG12280 [Ipomoea batatas]
MGLPSINQESHWVHAYGHLPTSFCGTFNLGVDDDSIFSDDESGLERGSSIEHGVSGDYVWSDAFVPHHFNLRTLRCNVDASVVVATGWTMYGFCPRDLSDTFVAANNILAVARYQSSPHGRPLQNCAKMDYGEGTSGCPY